MQTLDELARDFSPAGTVWERRAGGLPFLVVNTARCSARLTPYGAHVCEWTPAGQRVSALFLSPHARFAEGTAIRGGVPICFPWFAAHPSDPSKPAHGFARTRMWQVADVAVDEVGQIHVAFRLDADAATRALWGAAFSASLTVSLGLTLTITLDVHNTGVTDITYESALHTYLAVADVTRIEILGLEHTRFIDKVDGARPKVSGDEPLMPAGDTDRVFLDTGATCMVADPSGGRTLRVQKHGSLVTVVWNPGRDKGRGVTDIGDAWRGFVCVEAASCGPHAIRLAPGARHAIATRIDVAPS